MPETSTAQGRYYVLDNGPVVDPARCGVCGYGGKERRYLDPRLDFEFYGTLIFCEECISSMARLFNFIEPAQALALEARVEEAERELIQLRAATAAMEAFRVAIGAGNVSSGPNLTVISGGAVDPVHQTDRAPEESLVDGTSASDDVAKSADESGRNDVRNSNAGRKPSSGLSL